VRLFLPINGANMGWMDVRNQSEYKLPTMRNLDLLTLRWCSFSGFGREDVGVVYACKCCQYFIIGSLQPIGT
jgi:hypothetical protein